MFVPRNLFQVIFAFVGAASATSTYVSVGNGYCDWHFVAPGHLTKDACQTLCDSDADCTRFSVGALGCRYSKCGSWGGPDPCPSDKQCPVGSDPLHLPHNEVFEVQQDTDIVGNSTLWTIGASAEDVYRCSLDTTLCQKTSVAAKGSWTIATVPDGVVMDSVSVFTHAVTNGTWSVSDDLTKLSFASDTISYDLPFECACL